MEFEIYAFRQAKQNSGETMNSYHSRLRQLAATCEFNDVDKEIKSQIQLCTSQRLRGKALRDSTMTLQTLLYCRGSQKGQPPGKRGTPQKGNRKQRRRNFKPPRTVNQVNKETTPHSPPSSSDDEYTFTLDSATKGSAPFVSLKVSAITCKFLVDSGASVNIVSHDVSQMFDSRLEPCDTKVYAFNSSKPLSVLGKFKALVESKYRSVDSEFLVVDGKTCLLGYTTATDLGNTVSVGRKVFQSYPSLFSGFGKMKNVEVKLHIDESVKPVHQSHRRIPFHQRKNLEACVESLLQQDIIEPSDGPTPWVSPVVLVLKPK